MKDIHHIPHFEAKISSYKHSCKNCHSNSEGVLHHKTKGEEAKDQQNRQMIWDNFNKYYKFDLEIILNTLKMS